MTHPFWGGSRAAVIFTSWILAALAVCTLPSGAVAEETEAWTPPGPAEMPDKFDWVQLPSGEWLGGEIKVLYEDSVEFDSDEMGLTSIDWEDVVELRTVRILEVRPVTGPTATGRVFVKDGKVRVLGDETTTFDQTQVLSMTAGVPKERNFWSGEASGSADYKSGNTDTESLNARINLQRRTVEQRMIFDYIGNYDETEGEETENNHRVSGDWDRFVTDRFFWTPLFGEYFKDKFQNIKHRGTIGVGIGYEIIDTPTTEWRVSGGPAYTKTWFEDVEDGENDTEESPAFQGKTRFDHELTDDIDIWYDYRFLFANDDTGGYSHRMETGIAIEIIGDLDLRATYVWDYIDSPAADDKGVTPDQDDTQLLLGFGYTF
jgi:putative salt-induced outer membrane protein YdiY